MNPLNWLKKPGKNKASKELFQKISEAMSSSGATIFVTSLVQDDSGDDQLKHYLYIGVGFKNDDVLPSASQHVEMARRHTERNK